MRERQYLVFIVGIVLGLGSSVSRLRASEEEPGVPPVQAEEWTVPESEGFSHDAENADPEETFSHDAENADPEGTLEHFEAGEGPLENEGGEWEEESEDTGVSDEVDQIEDDPPGPLGELALLDDDFTGSPMEGEENAEFGDFDSATPAGLENSPYARPGDTPAMTQARTDAARMTPTEWWRLNEGARRHMLQNDMIPDFVRNDPDARNRGRVLGPSEPSGRLEEQYMRFRAYHDSASHRLADLERRMAEAQAQARAPWTSAAENPGNRAMRELGPQIEQARRLQQQLRADGSRIYENWFRAYNRENPGVQAAPTTTELPFRLGGIRNSPVVTMPLRRWHDGSNTPATMGGNSYVPPQAGIDDISLRGINSGRPLRP